MLELFEKLEILKNKLDSCDSILKLTRMQEEILNNRVLYQKIVEKNGTVNQEEKVLEYRKLENEVNFLILEINRRLKENFKKEVLCHNENN